MAESHTRPVIVLITGPRCPPCEVLKPKMESLATARGVSLYMIDCAKHPADAALFNVEFIPKVVVIDRGLMVFQRVGPDVSEIAFALDRVSISQVKQ